MTAAKSFTSARKIVVFTTSSKLSPAASRTDWRLRSERSAWASTPSASSPVAGSSPSWPEQKTRSPLRIALAVRAERGRRAVGLDGLAGHASLLLGSRVISSSGRDQERRRGDERRAVAGRGDEPGRDGRADGRRGEIRVVERRIERPQGRARSRTARSGGPSRRVSARRSGTRPVDDRRRGRQEVVRRGEDAGPLEQLAGAQPGAELAREVLRAAGRDARLAHRPAGPGREDGGGVGRDRRRHEEEAGRALARPRGAGRGAA